MFHFNINVGTRVRPVCDDVLPDVSTESTGIVIMLRRIGRDNHDFHATILWDNGTETFLNAVFFLKTVEVIGELGV